jgi:hypothetical protein
MPQTVSEAFTPIRVTVEAVDKAVGSASQPEAPESPRRARIVTVALAIAVLVLAGWAVVVARRAALMDGGPATAGALGSSSTLPPSSSGTSGADVALTLRASPAEARFTIDDGPPLSNPFIGRHAKDGAQHRITVVAPGYTTATRLVAFDDDVALQLSLAVDPLADAGARTPGRGIRHH